MKSLKAIAVFEDGDVQTLDFKNGKQFIQTILGDDFPSPPRHFTLYATDQNGTQVSITVPYDESEIVRVI